MKKQSKKQWLSTAVRYCKKHIKLRAKNRIINWLKENGDNSGEEVYLKKKGNVNKKKYT